MQTKRKRLCAGILSALVVLAVLLGGRALFLRANNAVYRLTDGAAWHREAYWLPPSLRETAVCRLSGNWWGEHSGVRLLRFDAPADKARAFVSAMQSTKSDSVETLAAGVLQNLGLTAQAVDFSNAYRWTLYEQPDGAFLLLVYFSDDEIYLFQGDASAP